MTDSIEATHGTDVSTKNNFAVSRQQESILTLDLGTQTGWAIQSPSRQIITSGSQSFKTDRWSGGGMRFLHFTKFLSALADTESIGVVYYEEVRRHLGVDAAHAYGGFLAHLTAWCESRGIAYEGVPVGTIKKFIAGKGNVSKQQVILAVEALGHTPADDNEADALALMHWAQAHSPLGGVA